MTLILELKPETEARPCALALERGESPESLAASRSDIALLSDEERKDLEDEIDLVAIRRARLEDDPKDHKTLDDLRAALAQRPR